MNRPRTSNLSQDTAVRTRLVAGFDLDLLRADPVLADIVKTAAAVCDAPVSHISLLDADNQHTVAAVGMSATRMPIERTFCRVAIESREVLIIEDLTHDARFANHPFVVSKPSYRFYVSLPVLVSRRIAVGTFCVLDTSARRLTIDQRASLFALLRQAELQLQTHLEASLTEDLLQTSQPEDEKSRAQIRARKDVLSAHLISYGLNQMASLKSDAQYLHHNLRFGAQLRELHENALADISTAVDAATQSLRNARTLVQSDDGTFSNLPEVSISTVISHVLSLFEERIARRPGSVDVSHMVDDDRINAAPVLLQYALVYLLHIALDSTPAEQNVEISIRPTDDAQFAFEVMNTSEAPTEDEFERLSRRNSLGDDATDIEDTALARLAQTLTFCRLVAEAHGGRLVCEEVDQGQKRCFRLELPV